MASRLIFIVLMLLFVSGDFQTDSIWDKTGSNILNTKSDFSYSVEVDMPYTIEILIVVDWSTKIFHGADIIENYVVSLMSIAANVLEDASIGNLIHVAVVGVMDLDIKLYGGNFSVKIENKTKQNILN